MGRCQKCGKPDVNNSSRCKDHPQTNLEKQNERKLAATKAQMEEKQKEGAEKRKAVAEEARKQEVLRVAKSKKINEIASEWNSQVKKIVTQVLKLRKDNPGKTAINAGRNGALGTIPGGTDNPLEFSLPSNNHKITRAEVFQAMAGFDSSDSGSFKFRVSNVLVHGK